MNKKKTKIIHVHFFSGHKNYYFGSVTAIFKMFTSKEIGCTEGGCNLNCVKACS